MSLILIQMFSNSLSETNGKRDKNQYIESNQKYILGQQIDYFDCNGTILILFATIKLCNISQ